MGFEDLLEHEESLTTEIIRLLLPIVASGFAYLSISCFLSAQYTEQQKQRISPPTCINQNINSSNLDQKSINYHR